MGRTQEWASAKESACAIVLADPFLKSRIQACTMVEESVEGVSSPLSARIDPV